MSSTPRNTRWNYPRRSDGHDAYDAQAHALETSRPTDTASTASDDSIPQCPSSEAAYRRDKIFAEARAVLSSEADKTDSNIYLAPDATDACTTGWEKLSPMTGSRAPSSRVLPCEGIADDDEGDAHVEQELSFQSSAAVTHGLSFGTNPADLWEVVRQRMSNPPGTASDTPNQTAAPTEAAASVSQHPSEPGGHGVDDPNTSHASS